MSDFNYDQFASNGDHIKWENVGDSVAGEIIVVRIGKDFNGADCPELVVRTDDGEDRIVTAGQKVLQNRLTEVRPRPGERVGITYSGVGDAKPGKAPAKLFTVQVRGTDGQLRSAGEGADSASQPQPQPAPQAPANDSWLV